MKKHAILALALASIPAYAGEIEFSRIAPGQAFDYPGLDTTRDGYAVRIGGFDAAWEFGATSGNYSTSSIVGAVNIPSGSYSGGTGWPDMGLAGYATTSNTSKTAVGVFAMAGVQVANANAIPANSVARNCNLSATGCAANGGFDFAFIASNEADVDIYTKSGGVAPSGNAAGFNAAFGGNIQPTGFLVAYRVGYVPGAAAWKTGFSSDNGTATTGMALGAQAASGPTSSQTFSQSALDGASAAKSGVAQINSSGDWIFTPPSGNALTMAGTGALSYAGSISAAAANGFYLGASQAFYNGSGFNIVSNGSAPGLMLNSTTSYLNTDSFVVRDNAQSSTYLTLASTGATFNNGITAASLPASAGAGGIYVCVDSSGVFYKKASCP